MAPLVRALRDRLTSQDGFTIIEAVVALTLLAIASAGFAVTTNGGLRMIGTSQERQTAVQVANEWMEQSRVIPFDGLALPDPTAWEGAGTPDEDVSGTTYTLQDGTAEELVLDAGATLSHVEYEEVNNIEFVAYRYVTWVTIGAEPQAYKRVTVVVQWDGTSTDSAPLRLTTSSIVSGDGIGWSDDLSTTPPVASDPCVGDSSAPTGTFAILDGSTTAGYSASSTVNLSISVSDACEPLTMAFSNDGTTFSAPVSYSGSATWTLLPGDGTRTVWAEITDGASNVLTVSDSIIVDSTAPTLCDGDVAGPSGTFAILAGTGAQAGYTSSSTVTLSLSASDPCAPIHMAFSNDGTTFSTPVAYDTNTVWTLDPGDGTRTMYTRYTDGVGNTTTLSSSVVVDGEAPTMPGGFTATIVNGPKRVELTWTASTDNSDLEGYRIYLASGSGSFQNQATGVTHPCPTTPCSWTHSGVKTKDTYTYYVVAYDAAGNESDDTAHLTRTI